MLKSKWITRLTLLLLIFIVLFLFFKLKIIWLPVVAILLKSILPFAIAAFISYLLHPVVEKLHQKGMNRGISILLIYVVFFGGAGFAIYRGIPVIIRELEELMEATPVFTQKYQHVLDVIHAKTSHWPVQYKDRVQDAILFVEKQAEAFLTKSLSSLVKIFDFVVLFAIIPFISFYYLKDWVKIKKAIWYITPSFLRKQGISFMKDAEVSIGSYIRGQLIVCVIIGVLSALFLWIAHVKYSLLLGVIIGITNVIPYFGPIIGALPALLIAAATSAKQMIWVAVIVFGLQFVEGNILSPMIVGKSLHMHPLIIMFSLFLGGEIGGVFGLILAVPILAIIKVAILHARSYYMKERQRKQLGEE
ncbi:AI-2E family transporter [Bacillus testis]|uniref:AI-2E family transporter n=1 Tax=Bacillus testis TaxID=1622072 RepID=UPI000A7E0491|nr:AI-2E family transporter [Bacillus testis]